jgi:hypothetical protein
LIRRLICGFAKGYSNDRFFRNSYGEAVRLITPRTMVARIVAKKKIMNTGFVNGMLHALSYFRLNFRFIDFAEHIHLPGWMKYELFNKWLFVLEGEPELGDEGEFLI